MKKIDKKAMEDLGIIGPILMENAGSYISREILKRFPKINKNSVGIVCGKGNNGGDGFVVARHLFNRGCSPHVILLAKKEDLKGDAELNCHIADQMGIPILEVTDEEGWRKNRDEVIHSDIIVDAIFGTGLTEPVKGRYVKIIEDINQANSYKVAVDIPSGISSNTFQIIGPCIQADLTVTMAAPKIAHIFPPTESYMGNLVIADISAPPFLFDEESLNIEFIEKGYLVPYFKKRENDTHKGTYGHLFILSGSVGKTGAAALAGKSALEMGAGLVTVGTPQSCLPVVAGFMMELMTEPLSETKEGTLSENALGRINDLLKGKDAVLIGPGISTHESTSKLILSLLPSIKVPTVLDADALNIISSNPEVLKSMAGPVVVTPHPGEFARMVHATTKDVVGKKLELVPQFARKYGVYVVLKGYRTVTAAPDGKVFINPTGNPGMATGGAGDVLSGIIASMVMQKGDFLEAILASIYVHGLSGDIGSREIGEKSLVAGDIIKYLPQAVMSMSDQ